MKRCQKGGAGAGGAAGAAGASAGAAPSVSAAASVSWAARAKEAVATGDVYRESSPTTSPTHPHPLAGKRPSSTDPTSHACTPERILAGFCRHSSSVALLTHGSTYLD